MGRVQILRLLLCLVIALVGYFGGQTNIPNAQAKQYELRYSDIGPPRGPRAKALMWWAEQLQRRSAGDLKIKFFWSQSLVKGKATLKAVGTGISDMGTVVGVYNPAELPVWNYSNTPFLHSDAWVGMRTWYELRKVAPELKDIVIEREKGEE